MIEPMLAHAEDEDWLLEIEDDHDWVVTRKWDGIRLLLFLNNTGNRLLTRAGRNVIGNVSQFHNILNSLDKTILDTEGVVPDDYLGDVHAAFHSKQATPGSARIKLVLFDCLRYKGQDLTHLPFRDRRTYLKEVYRILKNSGWQVSLERHVKKDKKKFYKQLVKDGAEGVMAKDLGALYSPGKRTRAWIKIKDRDTYEFLIIGFTKGTGKYADRIGAIRYGILRDGKVVEVGRSSGMTDAERLDMTLHPRKYIGRVAEFESQGITRAGAMRHPAFIQLRPDLCVSDVS